MILPSVKHNFSFHDNSTIKDKITSKQERKHHPFLPWANKYRNQSFTFFPKKIPQHLRGQYLNTGVRRTFPGKSSGAQEVMPFTSPAATALSLVIVAYSSIGINRRQTH